MPLQSAHVFCSHIGHSGKTTLCFNMSCYYAKHHPEVKVLVMDLAEEGDLTKRLLGGVDASREKVDEVFGAVFRLLGDADRKSSGLTSWLWTSDLDITKHAICVADHNSNVPGNLFLVSSGAWPRKEEPLPDAKRNQICDKIRDSLDRSGDTWKLFCDTDGDRRPSPFTMLGYSLCSLAIVPLHLNKADHERIETMLGLMNEMRQNGEINTQVLLVVWNMVKSQKDTPITHGGVDLNFTPTKVSLEILDACNRKLEAVARDPHFAGLFVRGSAETPEGEFLKTSVAVMRQLADNVLKPAEEFGMPFVQMVAKLDASQLKQLTFEGDGIKYQAKDDTIHCVDEALTALSEKFEAMTVDAH